MNKFEFRDINFFLPRILLQLSFIVFAVLNFWATCSRSASTLTGSVL